MFKHAIFAGLCVCVTVQCARAAEPTQPGPLKEHVVLKRFAGEWTSKSSSVAMGNQPAVEFKGAMKSSMLGEYWIISNVEGDAGEGNLFNAIQTIGYNDKTKKYVGTWVDSMMNHMWHYEGEYDAKDEKLLLVAEGPDFMGSGEMKKFRDSYQFKSPDVIVVASEMMGDDGKWMTFMTGEMTRVKAAQ